MKSLVVFAVFALTLLLLPAAHAQNDPDDQYLVIYGLIQQADAFGRSGEPRRALQDYTEAQNRLQHFHTVFPNWYPKIYHFRTTYLADKIAELKAELPSTDKPPAAASVPKTPAEAAKAKFESQIAALRQQLNRLRTDNATLHAKLKEALSVQPAMVSTTRFDQVQQQLRSLMKENALLKVSLAQQQGNAPTASTNINTNALQQLKQTLAKVHLKLAAQTARADKLGAENRALQTRLKSLLASAGAAEALRQENVLLKKQVASLKSAPKSTGTAIDTSAALAKAQAQIASLKSAAEISSLEKIALEHRLKQLQHATASPVPVAAEPSQSKKEARIRELEKERDELRAQLGEADKKLQARGKPPTAAQLDALEQQVATLRARIAVDEAKPIPYTPQELALFKQSTPHLAAHPNPAQKPVPELPGNVGSLAAAAQHYYSAKQYGKAAAEYHEILRHDKNNGIALGNLAAIELAENKLNDAEKHIEAALAQSPNDPYNLTVLGRIRFAQKKYDEALNALSRAEKLDPKNPDIENYLGVTLAEKGLRGQAETALRRAVELDPDYAAANNNLAVIYLTQKPPLPELARWHYEKALADGQPRNPTLEQLLAKDGAPVNMKSNDKGD